MNVRPCCVSGDKKKKKKESKLKLMHHVSLFLMLAILQMCRAKHSSQSTDADLNLV